MVEPDLPYIVALNDDPLSSDIRIYYIKMGDTKLGNDPSESNIGINISHMINKICYLKKIKFFVVGFLIKNSRQG